MLASSWRSGVMSSRIQKPRPCVAATRSSSLMITSRTAGKHRSLAFELGVNEYLGKPYQEDELLRLIRRHLAARASA